MTTLIERVTRWFREYRCKACGTRFSRDKPNCPACKTRKGGRGQQIPYTGGFVHGGDAEAPQPPEPQ